MNKLVSLINWVNGTVPAINDSNLNKMDREIDGLDDRIITLDTGKLDKTTAYEMVKSITYNESDGAFTVTYLNGTTSTLDTKLEKLAVNFEYDSSTEKLVITLSDGTKQYVDMSSLITEYNFEDSSTIDFSVTSGKVKADVIDGSITGAKLEPNYLANVTTKADAASSAATTASSKATEAKSYAVGGTGTRTGEDTDNAKYYYEQASAIVGVGIATTTTAGIVKPDGTTISVTSDGSISAEVITYGEDALTDDVSELTSNTMYCQVTDGNIVKAWIGVDGVAKPLSVDSPSETYSISAWCETVGLEYDTLDDISEADMSYLMNKHASADYFVEWYEHNNSMLTDFLANDYAMKGIGKWDYICDKLFAIDSAKSALLNSTKWEYILKDKVPTMTSNTAPSGVASVTNYYSDCPAYKVFNGIDTERWVTNANAGDGQRLIYKFENPICVNKVAYRQHGNWTTSDTYLNCQIKVQISNDNSTWETIKEETMLASKYSNTVEVDVSDNTKYALYVSVYFVGHNILAGSNTFTAMTSLQFYGRALTVSVPTMTSNTTPKGVVSSSVATSGQSSSGAVTEPYYLFAPNNTKYLDFAWGGDGTQDQYVQYEFEKPTVLESVLFKEYIRSGYKINKFEILYLDGSSWESCGVIDASSHTMGNDIAYNITNNVSAKTWRFHITETENGYKPHLVRLQFYGVDYSELQGISLTLTVEGAKGDNITVTDESGEIVSNVIFDSDTTSKEVTLTIIDGANYTFTSSIAKAIDGSGADYSKTVTLSEDITDVKVMPSGALYWYGNECEDVTGGWNANGILIDSGMVTTPATKNTNSIYCVGASGKVNQQVTQNEVNFAPYSHIYAYVNSTQIDGVGLVLARMKRSVAGDSGLASANSVGNLILSRDISDISTTYCVAVQAKAASTRNGYWFAVWFE